MRWRGTRGADRVVVTSVASGGSGQPGQRSYYVWKEPPTALPPAYDQYGNQVTLIVICPNIHLIYRIPINGDEML